MTHDDLTPEEREAAEGAGMTPERFAAMKGVRTIADWDALQRAERQREHQAEIRAAVREAMDERKRGA